MLRPGDTFERYTIDAAIGQGGMGSVYRAHDTRLDRRVALKVISEGAEGAEANARLVREARAAAALDHPNAVAIFDVGEVGGAPYIVMELVSGRTLREELTDGSASIATRVAWLADVARALAAAHKRGLIHRDIKPENVMVREDGVVKVLDFGIARRSKADVDPSAPTQGTALPTLTKEGVKVGTPVYMAPEQIRGDALDGRVDQFAWGVLSYEILAGRLPWRGGGDSLAVVASILTDEPSREDLERANVSPEVVAVVMRALSKRPADRFASMEDAARALDAALKGEGLPSSPNSPGARIALSSTPRSSSPASPASPASTTLMKRYSTDEVKEILARAVEQQEREGNKLAFDDLVAAAREVGVDPETLREASRDHRMLREARANDAVERDAWIRKKRRGFYRHVGIWLVVQVAFFIVGLSEGNGIEALKPGLFWAIGLGIHGITALMAGEDEWREAKKKIEAKEAKERQKRRRSEAIGGAIDEGAALLMKTGAAIRQRIVAAEDRSRVRVASTDTAHPDTEAHREAAAEHEAAEADRRDRQQRR